MGVGSAAIALTSRCSRTCGYPIASISWQVSAALVKAGKLHELVVIPGTGHGAAETAYGARKRVAFLRRHLLGE